MKYVFLTIVTMMLLFTSCSKDDVSLSQSQSSCDFINFKYYNDSQNYLGELSNEYVLIGIDTSYSDIEIQNLMSTLNQFDQSYDYTIHNSGKYKFKEIPVKFSSSKSCVEITQIISDLEENPAISYVHYTMQTDNCQNLIGQPIGDHCINSYGSNFYIKVFNENDLSDLNQLISETNTELVEQNEFMPKWFELRATKNSDGDALNLANYFLESGFFEHSEPGISKYPVD
ncbi:hypothetical protein [Psychroflexus aestuariivivens]|uniref:hypothetical protein n=1 Tax=Psychroflexus aestuariivivens TaxID=1795040 RepID=UPI000FD72ACB|nr:hypothetical protein [Psychroflexus aestuariivivens]